MTSLDVGDLVLTRHHDSLPMWFVRFGAALRNLPNSVDHVIIVHHRDPTGLLWGLEGRPGGVGYVALTNEILKNPYTISNVGQPKTQEQRFLIAKGAEKLIGTPYDWGGIALDAGAILGVDLWDKQWGDKPPGHVVCSAYADWEYELVKLLTPRQDRLCMPAHWAKLWIERGWDE